MLIGKYPSVFVRMTSNSEPTCTEVQLSFQALILDHCHSILSIMKNASVWWNINRVRKIEVWDLIVWFPTGRKLKSKQSKIVSNFENAEANKYAPKRSEPDNRVWSIWSNCTIAFRRRNISVWEHNLNNLGN